VKDLRQANAVDVLGDQRRAATKQAMPTAPIKLLAISVDGALLRSDGTIAQGVVQACRNAQRSGCVVVVATTRPPRGVQAVLQALDIVSPVITSNGALIWNPQEHKAQYHEPLVPEVVKAIVEEVRALEPDIVVGVEALDRWYVDPVDPRTDARFRDRAMGLLVPDAVGSLASHISQPVTRLTLLGQPQSIERVRDVLCENYWRPRKVAMPLSNAHLIQVTHPLADKAIALQRIAHHMNLKPEQVMAIGDGPNDIGMLEWAGFSVAMGNGTLAARDMADAVVPSNDEQGVARAIGRYVLVKR
jgi:Cof subfamily protein (haloacid dehalogenase superfamily)